MSERYRTIIADPPYCDQCDQCGRVGVRDFKVVGTPNGDRGRGIEWFIVCANQSACRKRWPKRLGFGEGE